MNRTFLYIMLFIVFILLLSMVEPSVMHGLLGAVILTLFKYLDTFVHELGHYLAGKLMGYSIKLVVIGDRKQLWSADIFGTSFIFCYGFGGLTFIESGKKASRLRHSIFALGGVMFQTSVIGIIYFTLGIGSEHNYYLPLLFMVLNAWTIIVSLYPRDLARYGKFYPSDGLLLKRILQAKTPADIGL